MTGGVKILRTGRSRSAANPPVVSLLEPTLLSGMKFPIVLTASSNNQAGNLTLALTWALMMPSRLVLGRVKDHMIREPVRLLMTTKSAEKLKR